MAAHRGSGPLETKALGVQMFRRDCASESGFVTIFYRERVEAMSRFAGDDPTRIHHLERDPEFRIEPLESVRILIIIASSGRSTTDAEDGRVIP